MNVLFVVTNAKESFAHLNVKRLIYLKTKIMIDTKEELPEDDKDDSIYTGMIYESSDTRGEVINMCCSSINSVENFDGGIETKENRQRINEIKRMALRLIHHHLSMLYDETFETED
jgi:hypothetical protein